MTCNCISILDGKLAEHNSRLLTAITFGPGAGVRAHVPTEKIEPRGKRPMGVLATFCPFCGASYEPAAPLGEP